MEKWHDVGMELNLCIEFTTSGSYDPGRCSGPPEGCYPPEEEDWRELTQIKIINAEGEETVLDQNRAKAIFNILEKEIYLCQRP